MAAITSQLQWSLVQRIRRWGWSRTLGLSLAALAGLVYLMAKQDLALPLGEAQNRLAVAQKMQPAPVSAEPLVMAFKDLPSASHALTSLAELQNLAAGHGLALNSGQYKMETDAGLVRYRMNLPLKGTYLAARGFLAEALAQYPNLALDNVRITRGEIGKSEVDAALQLSLYFKP